MNILGITAEFNPFHNGHRYLIEQAKKETNADACIIVMSGNFVQRGEPALMDKYARAEIALNNGADLVIELPVIAATASAEGFAYGAVSLLESLGVVSHIAFGSECTDLSLLRRIAAFLIEEPADFQNDLKTFCSSGLSYPAARAAALQKYLPDVTDEVLNAPNNILAIEYLKALLRLHSDICPIAVHRRGAAHHDQTLHAQFSSASSLRNALKSNENIYPCIPESAAAVMDTYHRTRSFLYEDDVFLLLLSKLLTLSAEALSQYAGCSTFLANKIKNACFASANYSSFLQTLASKDYTLSRIKRVLTHILLDIYTKHVPCGSFSDYQAKYARVLGCRSKRVLSEISKQARIPLITRLSRQLETLSDEEKTSLLPDIHAAHIYEAIVSTKSNCHPINEFTRKLITDTKESCEAISYEIKSGISN